MQLTGSAALVTGDASGLGRATATALLRAGAHVVIADLPSSPGAAVAEELAGAGPRVRFVPCDVTDPDTVQTAVDAASEPGPRASRSAARASQRPAACSPAVAPCTWTPSPEWSVSTSSALQRLPARRPAHRRVRARGR
ncbi:SDR family NAD(P)-dependent oxidoreductase [Streptomyces africanus]|uniref:SDR family NAD(P)-dependent oxidoreductase n=1 Tax=Streptomyces africanus TaxID=231024 RepID=UPI0027D8C7BD|nr:SDR family NAD(P)-dependent oxidoreductase [Streptomyces africanus]